MSVISIDDKRNVIPRWLEYKTACQIGLIGGMSNTSSKMLVDLDSSYVLVYWNETPSLGTAVDLVSLSIINKDFDSIEAKNAARYILKNESSLFPLHTELAKYFLDPLAVNQDELIEFGEIHHRKCISELRKSIRDYPINALAWSDLSICYAGIGKNKKSYRCATIALNLAKHNRFILRNVAHCFLHIGEPDRAVHTLRQSHLGKIDPWISSAEIAISENFQLKSKFLYSARDLIADENLSPLSRSELAAELGTLEYKHSGFKKSKKLIRLALTDPNENSLAQVEWCGRHSFADLLPHHAEVQAPFEANTWHHYFKKEFEDSLMDCRRWADFQPLSSTPIIQASFIAMTCLNNSTEAIKIIENTSPVVTNDLTVKNNYAFSLLSQGNIVKAEPILKSIPFNELSNIDKLIYKATQGMYAYRCNQSEIGESLYKNAIDSFDAMGEHTRAAIAAYYFAVEEKKIGSKNAESRVSDAKQRVKRYGVFALEDRIKKL